MRKKPRGQKYRNLSARGRSIYYERIVDGHRIKFSCKTDDWDLAAAVRDEYEARKGINEGAQFVARMARFGDFAERYLAEDTALLAVTTAKDRSSYLRPDGPLGYFSRVPLDEIDAPLLRRWWTAEIDSRDLTAKTGREYLGVIASVLGYAVDLGILGATPVPQFRDQLRRKARTKAGRERADLGAQIRPMADAASLHRLVAAAWGDAEQDFARSTRRRGGKSASRSLHERTGGLRAYVAVLAMLDGGLRVGEVAGLTWGQIRWGSGEDDLSRALVIDRSRPRGGAYSTTKSGRARVVAMSRRLRSALSDLYASQFEPGPESPVLPGFHPRNFANRPWRRILRRAGLEHHSPKDLRDSYASWLLSAGVQLGYVSEQLGHGDVSVTARHYARWMGGATYREPLALEEGEVPADLLARIPSESHQSPTTPEEVAYREPASGWDAEGNWRARHDSNVRPPGPQPGALSN